MNVEYFDITKDFWIARWLKKPRTKEILKSKKIIVSKGYIIKIGISVKVVNKVMTIYKNIEKYNRIENENDLSVIALNMELPLPVVLLILKNKSLIKNE